MTASAICIALKKLYLTKLPKDVLFKIWSVSFIFKLRGVVRFIKYEVPAVLISAFPEAQESQGICSKYFYNRRTNVVSAAFCVACKNP